MFNVCRDLKRFRLIRRQPNNDKLANAVFFSVREWLRFIYFVTERDQNKVNNNNNHQNQSSLLR